MIANPKAEAVTGDNHPINHRESVIAGIDQDTCIIWYTDSFNN